MTVVRPACEEDVEEAAENPTGAVSVYERAGMHVERTNLIFEKSQG